MRALIEGLFRGTTLVKMSDLKTFSRINVWKTKSKENSKVLLLTGTQSKKRYDIKLAGMLRKGWANLSTINLDNDILIRQNIYPWVKWS